jgi:hypothetical protein
MPPIRLISIVALTLSGLSALFAGEAKLQFNRDIRPILSNKCFRCHGFDEKSRKADLRLDQRDVAIAVHDGKQAIAPNKPEQSELIARIDTTDADDIMPPPESKFSLTTAEKDTLRRWIAEGAEYEAHWSLIPPKPNSASQNSTDDFVLARLQQAGLSPCERLDHSHYRPNRALIRWLPRIQTLCSLLSRQRLVKTGNF